MGLEYLRFVFVPASLCRSCGLWLCYLAACWVAGVLRQSGVGVVDFGDVSDVSDLGDDW